MRHIRLLLVPYETEPTEQTTVDKAVLYLSNEVKNLYIFILQRIMATVIKCVRVFKIENNGELVDKCKKTVDLLCEYDPQGINLKVVSGKYIQRRN